MNHDEEINMLQDRIRRLEKSIEKLERSPFSGLPWWRRTGATVLMVVVTFGSVIGLMGHYQMRLGNGPVFFDVHKLTANTVQTVHVDFQHPDDDEAYWGKIEGRNSTINLHSEDGSVRIDPTGIRIEGPDGVLILKPEKK
jgi:hypothetical protein